MVALTRVALIPLLAALAACGEAQDGLRATERAATDGTLPPERSEPAPTYPQPVPPSIDLDRHARPASSPGRTTCHGILGFLTDADPVGRIVRAAPSRDAAELGRLPPPRYSEEFEYDFPFAFKIVGSQDGWLEIDSTGIEAGFRDQSAVASKGSAYQGRGWIAAGGVHVIVQSRTGFAEPSHGSAVLIDAHPANSDLQQFGPRRVIACSGRWILADWDPEWSFFDTKLNVMRLAYRPEAIVRRDPLVLRAWVAGICNIYYTTCDGLDGSFAESSWLDRAF